MNALPLSDVSRETSEHLRAFEHLVQKWSPRINLVSKADLNAVWERHIVDSAQIFQHAPKTGRWVDLGSGGGFPGIVAAILSKGYGYDHHFTLVESDQRKCAFLRTAARELGLGVVVETHRIEEAEPFDADILSARALASLDKLLEFASRHLAPSGVCLFPKGANWQKEHDLAQAIWSYRLEAIKSSTNPAAAVLRIQDITRV